MEYSSEVWNGLGLQTPVTSRTDMTTLDRPTQARTNSRCAAHDDCELPNNVIHYRRYSPR
jgi:hypothetical protein